MSFTMVGTAARAALWIALYGIEYIMVQLLDTEEMPHRPPLFVR